MQYRAAKTVTRLATGGAALALSVAAAGAGTATVIGDSIGVGISMAGRVPRLAHNSVTIRGDDALRQIGRLPADSAAVLSLGTNDAVGSIAGVERGIDRIVDASRRSGVRLVWVGPPCVLKRWNATVQRLDAILRARLADRVSYVSVADPAICDRSLRAADGVHFTMRGYEVLWARASAALPPPGQASSAPALSPALPSMTAAASLAAAPLRPDGAARIDR